jgi:hypothetical protein
MPDRSSVIGQTKTGTLVLQVGGSDENFPEEFKSENFPPHITIIQPNK